MLSWLTTTVKITNFDNRSKIKKNNYFEPFVFNQIFKSKKVKSIILVNELKTDKLVNLSREERGSDRIRLFYKERTDKREDRFEKLYFLKNILKYDPEGQSVNWDSAKVPFEQASPVPRALGVNHHFSKRFMPFTYKELDGGYGAFNLRLSVRWSALWNWNFNSYFKGINKFAKVQKYCGMLALVNSELSKGYLSALRFRQHKFLSIRFRRRLAIKLNKKIAKLRLIANVKPYGVLGTVIHKQRQSPFRLFKARKKKKEKKSQKILKRLRKRFGMVTFRKYKHAKPYRIYDSVKYVRGHRKIKKIEFSIHAYSADRELKWIYARALRFFLYYNSLDFNKYGYLKSNTLLGNNRFKFFSLNINKKHYFNRRRGHLILKSTVLCQRDFSNFFGILGCDYGRKNLFRGLNFEMLSVKINKPYNVFVKFASSGKPIKKSFSSWRERSKPRFESRLMQFVKGLLVCYFFARIKLFMLLLRPLLAFIGFFKESPTTLKKYALKQSKILKQLSKPFIWRMTWFLGEVQPKILSVSGSISTMFNAKLKLYAKGRRALQYLQFFLSAFNNLLGRCMISFVIDLNMRKLFQILQDTEFRELDKFGRPEPDWVWRHDDEFDESLDVGPTYGYYRDEFLEGLGFRYIELGGQIYNRNLVSKKEHFFLDVGQDLVKVVDFSSLFRNVSKNFLSNRFLTKRLYQTEFLYSKLMHWRFSNFFNVKANWLLLFKLVKKKVRGKKATVIFTRKFGGMRPLAVIRSKRSYDKSKFPRKRVISSKVKGFRFKKVGADAAARSLPRVRRNFMVHSNICRVI